MMDKKDIEEIKKVAGEFFSKMTIPATKIGVSISEDVVILGVFLEEPQVLIGQGGRTLFEAQRILRIILNKKLQKVFYLDLDINEYKTKKTEYLKSLAKDLADQVSLSKEAKVLFPMPSYERRVVHQELSKRTDIVSESHGEGEGRHIVIKPRES